MVHKGEGSFPGTVRCSINIYGSKEGGQGEMVERVPIHPSKTSNKAEEESKGDR